MADRPCLSDKKTANPAGDAVVGNPCAPRPRSRALVATVGLGAVAAAVACGIGIGRDYSKIPVGQVGFDDMCGLQDYFDTIEASIAKPPTVVSAVDIEADTNKRIQGGKNRFAFDTDFQLKHVKRVLSENWNRLPEGLAGAQRIDIEVHWSEKAGVRRVVTDTAAELILGRDDFPLPYHVCLSELLYGEPLYHQRREMTGRSLPYRSLLGDGGIGPEPPATKDAGGTGASAPAAAPASTDAGAAPPPTFKAAPPAQ